MKTTLSTVRELEERVIDDIATAHELVAHDHYEMSAYRTLDDALAQVLRLLAERDLAGAVADIEACRRVLAEVRRRDLPENERHRVIAQPIALSAVAS